MMRRTFEENIPQRRPGWSWSGILLVFGSVSLVAGILAWYLDKFNTPYQNAIHNTVLGNVSAVVCCIPAMLAAGILFLFAFLIRPVPRRTMPPPERLEVVAGQVPPMPTCPKCGSVRLNHKLDGHIQCNNCGHEW
jgi:ribosomal protein L32